MLWIRRSARLTTQLLQPVRQLINDAGEQPELIDRIKFQHPDAHQETDAAFSGVFQRLTIQPLKKKKD